MEESSRGDVPHFDRVRLILIRNRGHLPYQITLRLTKNGSFAWPMRHRIRNLDQLVPGQRRPKMSG